MHGAKFFCPHALADGNQRIGIREKTLEFSSTLSPYLNNNRIRTTGILRNHLKDIILCLGCSPLRHIVTSIVFVRLASSFTYLDVTRPICGRRCRLLLAVGCTAHMEMGSVGATQRTGLTSSFHEFLLRFSITENNCTITPHYTISIYSVSSR